MSENEAVKSYVLNAAIPMLVAQILSLLYNIVDRVYIARIPDVGTNALGAVGLCFPIIMIMTAFSNLFGSDMSNITSFSYVLLRLKVYLANTTAAPEDGFLCEEENWGERCIDKDCLEENYQDKNWEELRLVIRGKFNYNVYINTQDWRLIMDQEKVIVIDFGGQYNQLVAHVRECNVY